MTIDVKRPLPPTRQTLVQLVGAGPGDPELLTIKALRAIESADAVVYDRLLSREILAHIPASAKSIDVGKTPGFHPVSQDEINRILIALARNGGRIVRLKGGDPFMFGRGGEEAIALAAAGVPYEVIPGITSAQGCAASLKIPLTHRDLATGVRFLTGHRREDAELDFDWPGLVDSATTLVIYMGLANIGEIAKNLLAHGRDAKTPVLAVSRATRADETRLVSCLSNIARDVGVAGLQAPTLFIIGEVAGIPAAMHRVLAQADTFKVHGDACVAAE
ncbi:MAG: uroporphyrinogen-III C-methyltransferase [Hyphomicrobiaceae bacterium]